MRFSRKSSAVLAVAVAAIAVTVSAGPASASPSVGNLSRSNASHAATVCVQQAINTRIPIGLGGNWGDSTDTKLKLYKRLWFNAGVAGFDDYNSPVVTRATGSVLLGDIASFDAGAGTTIHRGCYPRLPSFN